MKKSCFKCEICQDSNLTNPNSVKEIVKHFGVKNGENMVRTLHQAESMTEGYKIIVQILYP